jgi:hypothetical protein
MTIQLIDPKLIDPNPFQPPTRLQFTADNLADLDCRKQLPALVNRPSAAPTKAKAKPAPKKAKRQ